MKVLHVVAGYPTPERPHNQVFIRTQVESLRAAGVNCEVLVLRGRGARKYATGHRQVRGAIREHAPVDLIHAHYAYCAIACLSQGVPLVTSLLGSDLVGSPDADGRYSRFSRWSHRALARFVADRSSACIVKSRQMREVIARDVHVIANGVDLERFHPAEAASRHALRAELGLAPAVRYVLCAGDPAVPRKRFALARAAVAEAARAVPFPLEILPLAGRTHEDVVKYMQACDALLLTSSWEGSPNVVKEAMAVNMAVVAVEVGDTRERLQGISGCRLAARDDASTIGAALADVLVADEPRGSREAVEALRIESVADAVMAIYRQVLARGGSRRQPAVER